MNDRDRDLAMDLADGRLSVEEARSARERLSADPEFRRLVEEQSAMRALVRARSGLVPPAPFGLETRIRARLDEVAPRRPWWRLVPVSLAVAAVALALVLWPRGGGVDLGPLVDVYVAAEAGLVEVAHATGSPSELEQWYRGRGEIGFPPTVLDLEPKGFRLVGGVFRDTGGVSSRVSLYRGDGGLVVCDRRHVDTFPGPVPADGESLFYSQDGVQICVSRHGPEICCLMARMEPSAFRARLARQPHRDEIELARRIDF